MTEQWKPIDGFEHYSISSHGQVCREISKGRKERKILKQYTDRKGYKYVCLSKNSNVSTVRIHRLVSAAFVAGDLSLTVNHIDLDKTNNRADNLELITRTENTKHATKNGHISTSGAKIDYEQAVTIRMAKILGQTSKALSEEFNVSKRTIERIVRGELWKQEPKC